MHFTECSISVCLSRLFLFLLQSLRFNQDLVKQLLVKLLSHTQNLATYDFMTIALNERWQIFVQFMSSFITKRSPQYGVPLSSSVLLKLANNRMQPWGKDSYVNVVSCFFTFSLFISLNIWSQKKKTNQTSCWKHQSSGNLKLYSELWSDFRFLFL